MPRPASQPQQNQPMATFNLPNQREREDSHQSFRFWQHLQTNLKTDQGEKYNKQSSDFSEKNLICW